MGYALHGGSGDGSNDVNWQLSFSSDSSSSTWLNSKSWVSGCKLMQLLGCLMLLHLSQWQARRKWVVLSSFSQQRAPPINKGILPPRGEMCLQWVVFFFSLLCSHFVVNGFITNISKARHLLGFYVLLLTELQGVCISAVIASFAAFCPPWLPLAQVCECFCDVYVVLLQWLTSHTI